MKRRHFINLLGGAVALPLAARAQQGERVRRIGVLMPVDKNDPVMKTSLSAFTQALAGLGWIDGRNARTRSADPSAVPPLTNPTTGIVGCCARAASGHVAAAPPTSVMNSRRFIR